MRLNRRNRELTAKADYHYDLRQYQLRSIRLLQAIDKVCREHGLTYYMIGGTLLGAVRNGGFIPWDDDMDIGLLRSDYDLLVQHADEWLPKPFHIVTHLSNPQYPKYFAKIEDCSTTIVERRSLGYVGGIYMDIFPMDDVPDNKLLRRIHLTRFRLVNRILYFVYRDPYKHGHGIKCWIPLLIHKAFKRERVHAHAQKILKEYHGCRKCSVATTHNDGMRAWNKAEILGTPSRIEFEGFMAAAPADTDRYLKIMYGDYMKLPPAEDRVSHFHEYCDLNTPYESFDIKTLTGK